MMLTNDPSPLFVNVIVSLTNYQSDNRCCHADPAQGGRSIRVTIPLLLVMKVVRLMLRQAQHDKDEALLEVSQTSSYI